MLTIFTDRSIRYRDNMPASRNPILQIIKAQLTSTIWKMQGVVIKALNRGG